MADQQVKIRLFTWHEAFEDELGVKGLRERSASFGETIDASNIPKERLQQAQENGWIGDPEEETEDGGEGGGGDPASMSAAELSEYIKGNNPQGKALTVNEILALVGDDPDFAERMLEAENSATGGMPRSSLSDGLNAVIEGD